MKYRENQRQKLCSDHTQHIKSRKLSLPTKKLDCPVRFQVKKIYRFPKFAIIKDTKPLRDVNSKALKEVLGKSKLDRKTLFEESFGHLEYVCMIPPDIIYSYNHMFIISKHPSSLSSLRLRRQRY